MYRLGLYEKALPNNFNYYEILIAAKDAGFDFVELSIDETDERLSRLDNEKEQDEIISAMKKAGINFESICLSGHRKYPLGSSDPSIQKKSIEILEKAVILAKKLGINLIQLAGYDVYYEESNEKTVKDFKKNLEYCVNFAAAYGVNLGFETMETVFMDTISKAMPYVNTLQSPYLGVYPDIGNLQNAVVKHNLDYQLELQCGKGHIFAAHLKETQPGVYRDMDFGDGHTPFVEAIGELYKQGVRRFTAEFWDDPEQEYTERLSQSLKFLKDRFNDAGVE